MTALWLAFKTSRYARWIAAIGLGLAFLVRFILRIERKNQKLKKLEAEKATTERMDNAQATDNADDARSNLAKWMRRNRK